MPKFEGGGNPDTGKEVTEVPEVPKAESGGDASDATLTDAKKEADMVGGFEDEDSDADDLPVEEEKTGEDGEGDAAEVTEGTDYPPLSEKAQEKCEAAGLSPEQVQELREIPAGDKPDPSEYLDQDYIDDHLNKFSEDGCYKFIAGEPNGTIGSENVFVTTKEEAEQALAKADGDPRKLEEALGLEEGDLGDDPYIVKIDEPENLRMATGNEQNAYQSKWCPGGTTLGGMDEAVIDPVDEENYSFKHCFGDEDWQTHGKDDE